MPQGVPMPVRQPMPQPQEVMMPEAMMQPPGVSATQRDQQVRASAQARVKEARQAEAQRGTFGGRRDNGEVAPQIRGDAYARALARGQTQVERGAYQDLPPRPEAELRPAIPGSPLAIPPGQVGKWYFGPTVSSDGTSVSVGFAASVACQVQPKLYPTFEHGGDSSVQFQIFPNLHQTVSYADGLDTKADLDAMTPEAIKAWAQQAQQRLLGASEEVSPRETAKCELSAEDAGQWLIYKGGSHPYCGGSYTSELIELDMQVIDAPTRSNHLLPNGVNMVVLTWPIHLRPGSDLVL